MTEDVWGALLRIQSDGQKYNEILAYPFFPRVTRMTRCGNEKTTRVLVSPPELANKLAICLCYVNI